MTTTKEMKAKQRLQRLDEYDRAMDRLKIPQAFLMGMQAGSRYNCTPGLEECLTLALSSIKSATCALQHAFEREQAKGE